MIDFLRNPLVRETWAPERRRFRIALAAMTGRGIFALALPYLVGRTIGAIHARAGADEVRQLVIVLGCFTLLTAFCQFWMRWLHIRSSRDFEARLRERLFRHLTTLGYGYFNRARTGDIMSRLTADVEAVRMGMGPGIMHLYQTGTMVLGAIVIMMLSYWQLTLLALLPLAMIFLFIRRLMPVLHQSSLAVQERLGSLSALAQESFSGSRVVKAFAREDYEIGRFDREASRYIDDSMSMAMARARMHVVIEVMAGLVSIAVLFIGGRAVIDARFDLADFVSFFGYFNMLIWPMVAIGWTLALFERAKVALGRVETLLAEKPAIVDGPRRNVELDGSWSIRDLRFSHEGAGKPVLDGLDIEIPAGRSLAVVGPTGCGKSTLVQLLGRLLDPPTGSILQNGIDVRDLALSDLRGSVTMVPQETFLFSDTIRANIAYARPDLAQDEEALRRVAEQAQVLEAIEAMPAGFDQLVGERGITLSGGQKQRIAIARALFNPAPTLILDDCLSAVDTQTEEHILEHLIEIMKGRTTIIVAHRLSSVLHCDEIVVLRDGRISERGSHAELLRKGGWYADTYRRQLIEEELEAA